MSSTVERARQIARAHLTPLRIKVSEEVLLAKMSPATIKTAQEGIRFLVENGGLSPNDAAELLAASSEALDILLQKSSTRRAQLKRALKVGGLTTVAAGPVGFVGWCTDRTFGPTAYRIGSQQQLEYDRTLEATSTLGLQPSITSTAGYTVRYASKTESGQLSPTKLLSLPLPSGSEIKLVGSRLDEVEGTGIVLRDHVRTSDTVPVGKLAVFTVGKPGYPSSKVGQEFVLRSESTPEIDAEVLVLENNTGPKFLAIQRFVSPGSNKLTFQLTLLAYTSGKERTKT